MCGVVLLLRQARVVLPGTFIQGPRGPHPIPCGVWLRGIPLIHALALLHPTGAVGLPLSPPQHHIDPPPVPCPQPAPRCQGARGQRRRGEARWHAAGTRAASHGAGRLCPVLLKAGRHPRPGHPGVPIPTASGLQRGSRSRPRLAHAGEAGDGRLCRGLVPGFWKPPPCQAAGRVPSPPLAPPAPAGTCREARALSGACQPRGQPRVCPVPPRCARPGDPALRGTCGVGACGNAPGSGRGAQGPCQPLCPPHARQAEGLWGGGLSSTNCPCSPRSRSGRLEPGSDRQRDTDPPPASLCPPGCHPRAPRSPFKCPHPFQGAQCPGCHGTGWHGDTAEPLPAPALCAASPGRSGQRGLARPEGLGTARACSGGSPVPKYWPRPAPVSPCAPRQAPPVPAPCPPGTVIVQLLRGGGRSPGAVCVSKGLCGKITRAGGGGGGGRQNPPPALASSRGCQALPRGTPGDPRLCPWGCGTGRHSPLAPIAPLQAGLAADGGQRGATPLPARLDPSQL